MNQEQQETLGPSAKVICDSVSLDGHRLTTLEVVMHRFILAEMNTHRVFSRNSASSRAIPYKKIRERVVRNTAYPVKWGAEKPGMQSGDSLGPYEKGICQHYWDGLLLEAVKCADECTSLGLHKSLVNRLLEPFMWHTAIISSTEWANFFSQRCHPDAQPEMKAVADKMYEAYTGTGPVERKIGEWHLPYISPGDYEEAEKAIYEDTGSYPDTYNTLGMLKKVSTARCARVSYLTHDGKRDIRKDVELYEKLESSGHWSPFEHIGTPAESEEVYTKAGLVTIYRDTGNFTGWKQFRKEFKDENRTQFTPIV